MQKVITEDNYPTFFNSKLQEYYHSITGAVEEAVEKFARPSGVADMAGRVEELVIMDVCFGLGYNTAAVLDLVREISNSCKVTVYAFENDRDIINKTYDVETPFSSYSLIREAVSNMKVEKNNINIQMLMGDAREEIHRIPDNTAHAVLFDPFSPQKVPYMWEDKFFRNINLKMKAGARLVTYSCAGMVRRNLKAAGFEVMDGPRVKRRSPSTIAVKPV